MRARLLALACLAVAALGAPRVDAAPLIHEEEHFVEVGAGVQLHVVEKYVDAAAAQQPHRALLMLPSAFTTERQWDADVGTDASLSALDRAAAAGFFAFAVTYEGSGDSTHPEDGLTVTAARLLDETGALLEWIRTLRAPRRVDLLGAGLGSTLAAELGSSASPVDTAHVGRVVLTSLIYRAPSSLFRHVLLGDVGCGRPRASRGYVSTSLTPYIEILKRAAATTQQWGFQKLPGQFAAGPIVEGCDLPIYEAADGRAEALIFWGDADTIATRADADAFAAEYGGAARVSVLVGGGNAPSLEPVRDAFWTQVFAFLHAPIP